MKKFLLFLTVLSLLSCTNPSWQLRGNCNYDKGKLFKQIVAKLMTNNAIIRTNDLETGYLMAETIPQKNIWLNVTYQFRWVIQFNENYVTAICTYETTSGNVFGATTASNITFCGNSTDKNTKLYWEVREILEKSCGSSLVLIDANKKQPSQPSQSSKSSSKNGY